MFYRADFYARVIAHTGAKLRVINAIKVHGDYIITVGYIGAFENDTVVGGGRVQFQADGLPVMQPVSVEFNRFLYGFLHFWLGFPLWAFFVDVLCGYCLSNGFLGIEQFTLCDYLKQSTVGWG